jgi:hypothetical protein
VACPEDRSTGQPPGWQSDRPVSTMNTTQQANERAGLVSCQAGCAQCYGERLEEKGASRCAEERRIRLPGWRVPHATGDAPPCLTTTRGATAGLFQRVLLVTIRDR